MLEGNTGEHSDPLKKLDVAAINNPELISSVEARLANLNAITKGTDRDDSADEDDDQDKSTPGKDDQADDQDDKSKSTPDEDDGGNKDGDKDDGLPSAYMRAAIHRGWKQEVIEESYRRDPEAALKTFQNCYLDVNNASKEWALLGKAKLDYQKIADTTKVEPTLVKVDYDKLKDDYDLDDKAIALLRQRDTQIEEILKTRNAEPVRQAQQPVGPDPNVEIMVENFFGAETLKDYNEFYGGLKLGQDWSDLSSGQRGNRWKVMEQANLILVGADSIGHPMDPVDALERAHMVVSEPVREKVIRESIRNATTKRKNSMTIRPSDGSRTKGKSLTEERNGPRSTEELRSAVQDKLNKVFSN